MLHQTTKSVRLQTLEIIKIQNVYKDLVIYSQQSWYSIIGTWKRRWDLPIVKSTFVIMYPHYDFKNVFKNTKLPMLKKCGKFWYAICTFQAYSIRTET